MPCVKLTCWLILSCSAMSSVMACPYGGGNGLLNHVCCRISGMVILWMKEPKASNTATANQAHTQHYLH